jgi:hypothetical protein
LTFVKGLHAVAAPEAAECLEALVVADDAAITAKMLSTRHGLTTLHMFLTTDFHERRFELRHQCNEQIGKS